MGPYLSYSLFPGCVNSFDLIENRWDNKEEEKKRVKTQDLKHINQEANSMSSIRQHVLSNFIGWQTAYLAQTAVLRIHMCGIMLHKQDFKAVLVEAQGQKPFHIL